MLGDPASPALQDRLHSPAAEFSHPAGPLVDRAIDLACDLLVAGLDTPATVEVAALSHGTAEHLPHITDATLLSTVASYLAAPWARPVAFPALLSAFKRAPLWQLGNALGCCATSPPATPTSRCTP